MASGANKQQWDDSALVAKSLKGDSKAWGELVDRYSGYVNALLKSTRLPEADLPDAFQYVFIELFRTLGKLENPGYVAPWLRQTAIRHAIRLRTQRGREEGLPEFDLESDSDVMAEVTASEERLVIRQAVASLKEQCRRLVTMLFFEDPPIPYAQVAIDLGLSVGSLGQTRQRCLEALRKALSARGVV